MEADLELFIKNSKSGMSLSDNIDITQYIRDGRGFANVFQIALRKYEKLNKVYQYMITFTIANSSGVDLKNEDQLLSIENDIKKYFVKNKLSKFIKFAYMVREGNKYDGKRPHWHVSVQSTIAIKKHLHFKNYLNTIGNIDNSKSCVKTCNNALEYFTNDSKKSLYKPIIQTLSITK